MRTLICSALLAACTSKPVAPAPAPADPLHGVNERVAEERLPVGRLKGLLFRSLLENGAGGKNALALKAELRIAERRWLAVAETAWTGAALSAARAGLAKDAILAALVPAEEARPASPGAGELDMIEHARDLNPRQRAKLREGFLRAFGKIEAHRIDIAGARSDLIKAALAGDASGISGAREHLEALDLDCLDTEVAAMAEASRVVRGTRLDRDYAYRAFLREHRNHVPGFRR